MKSWLDTNCDPEDEIDVVTDLVDTMVNYYCDGDKTAKSILTSKYTQWNLT